MQEVWSLRSIGSAILQGDNLEGTEKMRDLIERQMAIKAIIDWQEHHIGAMRKCDVAEVLNAVPVVTRMQEDSYQRLIGKRSGGKKR